MKKIVSLLLALALTAMPTLAAAADLTLDGPALTQRNLGYAPNVHLVQTRSVDLSTAYTNATTSATLIASASGTTAIALPATNRDYSKQYIRACWRAVGSKATSTTGTITLYANGGLIAATNQTITTASLNNNVSGCHTVARSSAAAQTIGLWGVSGDTAVFTVSAAYLEVWIITLNS